MSCCDPSVFRVPQNGITGAFGFPAKTAWRQLRCTFDLSGWLAPAYGNTAIVTEYGFPITTETGAPLTTQLGPDAIFIAALSVAPPDVAIASVVVGPGTITATLQDGVPYTEHLLTLLVETQQGRRAAFSGSVYVVGGDPTVSPYLADEFGYPITTETGCLLYWGVDAPTTWTYPPGSQVVVDQNGNPISDGDGQLVVS